MEHVEELFEPGRHFVQCRNAEDLESGFAVWLKPHACFAVFRELNVPGEALMAAANAFTRMGQGSRIGTVSEAR